MNAAPVFRDARLGDLREIVRLLATDSLGRTRETWNEDPDEAVLAPYAQAFEAIERDPNNRLIVVENGGRMIGCMQITLIPNLTFRGGMRLQIEGVRVDASMRGRRIGSAMIEWAVALAHERDCHLVQLTSNSQRTDAVRFYERLGFEASHIGFKRYLA